MKRSTSKMRNRDPQIITAIQERRRLKFVYHGKERVVEPQTYGLSTAGGEVLRAAEISADSAPGRAPIAKLFALEGLETAAHQ
jgi:hypothetical protein